jgi:hypothetical protein
VICQACRRETTAVTIAALPYCALCGSRLGDDQPVATTRTKRNLDVRQGGQAVVSTRGTGAHHLHERTTRSAHTIDLRDKPAARPKAKRSRQILQSTPVPTVAQIAPPPAIGPVALSHHTPGLPQEIKPPSIDRQPHDPSRVAERHARAKAISRSQHVSRFGNGATRLPDPEPAAAEITPLAPVFTPSAATVHSGLARYIPSNTAVIKPPRRRQIIGVAAAVAIMTGYVWLENYPKLQLQAAAARAGVAATSPSYLPSSYNLTSTTASPGLLTLSFKSPSQPAALTIGQAKTNWDTKDLLDNYVATNDPNYSSIIGQGLTVYLFNQNQAAWVNHGIWYTIKGTAQLSQDQILKIAYGL